MEPPPPPPSGRFRLRIHIIEKKDAHSTHACPKKAFTIAKNANLALPNLTLNELCAEIVKRYQQLYPGESLFAVDLAQDSSGSDLWLEDKVSDLFEDNDIFRVIKGASIRASVEPHRARSQSIQPNGAIGQQRFSNTSTSRAPVQNIDHRRHYNLDPDRPMISRERESMEPILQPQLFTSSQVSIIPDSQETTLYTGHDQGTNGFVQVSSSLQPPRYQVNGTTPDHKVTSQNRASPELGGKLAYFPADSDDGMGPLFDDLDRTDDEILPRTSSSGLKRKLSLDDGLADNQRRSSTSVTSHPQQENGTAAKKLKRVATYSKASKPKKLRDVYDDMESDAEGCAVPPATLLPQVVSALKLKAQARLRMASISSTGSSPALNGRSSREDSVASISRSLRSSPEDPAERLRRAKEAQRIALEKERERNALAQREDEERKRKAITAPKDEESTPVQGNEGGQAALTEEERVALAKDKRIADAEKAERERRRIIQDNAKREFDAEKKRIAKAKEEQQRRAEQEKAKISTEIAEKRVADAERERKRLDIERRTALAKASREVEAQAQARKEAAEKSRKVAEEKKKKDAGEKARRAAERNAKEVRLRAPSPQNHKITATVEEHSDTHDSATVVPLLDDSLARKPETIGFDGRGATNQSSSYPSKTGSMVVVQQIDKNQTPVRLLDNATSEVSNNSARGGMFARAVQEYERASQSDDLDSVDMKILKGREAGRMSCTPFIPRGRAAPPISVSQTSSPAIANSSPGLSPSSGVGIEAQMPLPRNFSRSVSFVELASKKMSLSSVKPNLKQTTLVPPRPLAPNKKTAPGRPTAKGKSKRIIPPKKLKGKEKAVDSPGSPPNPIQISSDESSSNYDSDDLDVAYEELGVGSAGEPAYPRGKKPSDEVMDSPANPSSSLNSCLKDPGSKAAQGDDTPKYSKPTLTTAASARQEPSTKLEDNLRLVSAAGFPTPSQVPLQAGSHRSTVAQIMTSKFGLSAKKQESLQSSVKVMASLGAPIRVIDTIHDLKPTQPMPSGLSTHPHPVHYDTKTIVPQTWSFSDVQGSPTDEPPSSPQLPEMPLQPKIGNQINRTTHDDPISTQLEVDHQLISQSRESQARSSSPEFSSSSGASSPTKSPVNVRGRLARMTKELLADVAAKKAFASSEPEVRAKREAEERLRSEAEEAVAARELSSTETESESDSDVSSLNNLDEDDSRVQGNLYNGTGFRKSVKRVDIELNEDMNRNRIKPRRGRKYQVNPRNGKMVKVGKYQYIDKKTGNVMEDTRRLLASIRNKKGTQQSSWR